MKMNLHKSSCELNAANILMFNWLGPVYQRTRVFQGLHAALPLLLTDLFSGEEVYFPKVIAQNHASKAKLIQTLLIHSWQTRGQGCLKANEKSIDQCMEPSPHGATEGVYFKQGWLSAAVTASIFLNIHLSEQCRSLR